MLTSQADRPTVAQIARLTVGAWAVSEVHETLTAASATGLRNPLHPRELSGYEDEMVLNGVYLVADAHLTIPDARGWTQRAIRAHRPRLELTGPWPPYNFVSCRRTHTVSVSAQLEPTTDFERRITLLDLVDRLVGKGVVSAVTSPSPRRHRPGLHQPPGVDLIGLDARRAGGGESMIWLYALTDNPTAELPEVAGHGSLAAPPIDYFAAGRRLVDVVCPTVPASPIRRHCGIRRRCSRP